jgi:hypothetical protein
MKHSSWLAALLWSVGTALSLAAQEAQVALDIFEAPGGKRVPARVHLKNAEGKAHLPQDLPFWNDHFVCPGAARFALPPGEYRGNVERGPEFTSASFHFTVAPAGRTNLSVTVGRLADLAAEGWWSGDLHVHRPVRDAELLMRAEDLHVAPIITWWNKQNAWANIPRPARLLVQFDNNRFYHLLAGEDERDGGALLYFNLPELLDLTQATRQFPSSVVFAGQARKVPGAWLDMEKPFWWDLPLWVAHGVGDSLGIAHNHLQRSGVLDNEAWGRPRDRQRFPGPHGNGLWTQEIYYHLLNCGLRIPPSAGSASGVLPNPVGYNRVYVQLPGELTWEKWWDGLRAGRCFVSNGPLLRCRANGQLPGHIFTATEKKPLTIGLEGQLTSRDAVDRVEIIQDGKSLRSIPFDLTRATVNLGTVTCKSSGWFLVRAITSDPKTFRFASTAPFYVEWGGKGRRISRSSAQFFLDWTRERMQRLELSDLAQRSEVLRSWSVAEEFWKEKVAQANAD